MEAARHKTVEPSFATVSAPHLPIQRSHSGALLKTRRARGGSANRARIRAALNAARSVEPPTLIASIRRPPGSRYFDTWPPKKCLTHNAPTVSVQTPRGQIACHGAPPPRRHSRSGAKKAPAPSPKGLLGFVGHFALVKGAVNVDGQLEVSKMFFDQW